jgi:serine/threonine-protein kinase RsbW
VNLKLRNSIADLPKVHREWEEFAAGHQLSPKVLNSIHLSLEEILSNIITYGFQDKREHEVAVHFEIKSNEVEVEIRDDGSPFNPLNSPDPDLSLSLDERPLGGMGIFMVRKMVDEMVYRRVGHNNVLLLKKRREAA